MEQALKQATASDSGLRMLKGKAHKWKPEQREKERKEEALTESIILGYVFKSNVKLKEPFLWEI